MIFLMLGVLTLVLLAMHLPRTEMLTIGAVLFTFYTLSLLATNL